MEVLYQLKEKLRLKNKTKLLENNLFFECLYWGISILDEYGILIDANDGEMVPTKSL